jgi:glucose/arabinose dehydrogenase
VEGPSRPGHHCQALVEELAERDDRRAWRANLVSLLELEIEEPLRFTEWTVDDPDTHPREFHRADILEYTSDGKFIEVYAHGIRNCVGEAINPTTGQLWCSTNECDNLGNHLVLDYVTSIKEGGFYGWPWYYMGGHQDPRLPQPCANGTGPNPQAAALTSEEAAACKRVDLPRR